MASVHEDQRLEARVQPVEEAPRFLTRNEMETARQGERDRGLLMLGVFALVVIVIGCIGLIRMGGPRVEDPLPYPPTTTGIRRDAWKRCDVYGLHLVCESPSGTKLDLMISSQEAMDGLCGALPCVRHEQSAGYAGNGNCPPECLAELGVTTTTQ
jgi:hypothetical protein